jgi:MFS family permease
MFSGLFIGMTVGASLLSYIAQEFGYVFAFFTSGLIVILIILYPISIKYVSIVKKRIKMSSLLFSEFKKKSTQLVTIFVPLLLVSIGLLTFVIPLYMSDSLQLKLSDIGLIISSFQIATMIGAIASGPASDKWGRRGPIAFFAITSAIFTASLIFANTWLILAIVFSTIGFLKGGYYVGINALLMDITNPKIGATQFSLLTSIGNFGELFGGMIGGTLIALLGFQRVFLYAALFLGPALLILYLIRIKRNITLPAYHNE